MQPIRPTLSVACLCLQEKDDSVKASVLMSMKPNDFVAGADISMFEGCTVHVLVHKHTCLHGYMCIFICIYIYNIYILIRT